MAMNELNEILSDLDKEQKDALNLAALLGDNFSMDDVMEMVGISPSKLFDLIDKLLVRNVIRSKSKTINGIFAFTQKQFLTLLHNSLSTESKRLYLATIVNYFESVRPHNNLTSTIIVDLIFKFKSDLNNTQYLKKAADLLLLNHQVQQARTIYKQIIDTLLNCDTPSMESLLFIETVITYMPLVINIYPPDTLLPIVHKANLVSVTMGNGRAEAMLNLFLGRLYQRMGNSSAASVHSNDGWRLSQEIDDEGLSKVSAKFYALFLFWQGCITQAIQVYEDTLGNVENIEPDLRDYWSYLVLALCYAISGHISRGVGLAEAVLARAVSKDIKNITAFSHAIIGVILLDVRNFHEAEIHIEKADQIGECIKSDFALYLSKQSKGYLEYHKGNLKKARDLLDEGFQHLEDTSYIHYPSPWFLEVLFSLHKAGFEPVKGYSFHSEINRLLEWPDLYMKGAALRYSAIDKLATTNIDNPEEIETALNNSCKCLQEAGAPIELGRSYIELARLYIKLNESSKSLEFTRKAHDILCAIDESLFPPQLSFLIDNQSPVFTKNRGICDLHEASECLPDFDKYIGRVATILTNMFGAEHTAILLSNKDAYNSFEIVASRNITPEELGLFQKDELQSLLLAMVQKGPLLITGHKHKALRHFAAYNIFVRSLSLTPIVYNANVIGIIYMDNRLISSAFCKDDRMLMQVISAQIAMSIKNSMLFNEYSKLNCRISHHIDIDDTIEIADSSLPVIIGKSAAIKSVLSNVKKCASTDTTVLIYGETGVGKELIAKAIHQLSKRSERPLIVVNIAALSKNLVSAELFGYEKGAFTDAVASKPGRFELANGGTIFLDEIGELSMDVQVKLLRVLQERTFERVGSNKSIYSDFRVIAATNKNLHEMVQKGNFRSDLYYRISIFPIQVPTLKDRKDDIPSLALHFMKKYSVKYVKPIKGIGGAEIEKLMSYSWPGNVRELENIIERAVIISSGDSLIIPNLQPAHAESSVVIQDNVNLQPLENIQRRHILRVLNSTKWRIRGNRGAAEILGLKPTTLEFRMKKLQISNPSGSR